MSARPAKASPSDVESSRRPPSGGESMTPIWDELADRWEALQPLELVAALGIEKAISIANAYAEKNGGTPAEAVIKIVRQRRRVA